MRASTEGLNKFQAAEAEARHISAAWYAWGWADAKGITVDTAAFAESYVEQHIAGLRGQSSFVPSVQSAFTTWKAEQDTREIEEHPNIWNEAHPDTCLRCTVCAHCFKPRRPNQYEPRSDTCKECDEQA